jgi:hypothetical protein
LKLKLAIDFQFSLRKMRKSFWPGNAPNRIVL